MGSANVTKAPQLFHGNFKAQDLGKRVSNYPAHCTLILNAFGLTPLHPSLGTYALQRIDIDVIKRALDMIKQTKKHVKLRRSY